MTPLNGLSFKTLLCLGFLRYLPFMYLAAGVAGVFALHARFGFGWELAGFVAAYLYLVPPAVFQLVFRIGFPRYRGDLRRLERRSEPGSPAFTIWFLSCQLQVHLLRFPFLEEVLRCVPELYSTWLRLWGARIGWNVMWTPRVALVDRPFLDVGTNAIIGTDARIASHWVSTKDGRMRLLLDSCVIGRGATVGGYAILGPGSRVEPGVTIPAGAKVKDGKVFTLGDREASAPASS